MTNKFKSFRFLLPLALSVFSLSQFPVYAEDIEIYLDPDPVNAGAPIVMLSIDMRPSVGAAICGGDKLSVPKDACKLFVVGYNADGTTTGNTDVCTLDSGDHEGSFDHLGNDYIFETDYSDPENIVEIPSLEERLWDNTKGKQVCGNPYDLYHLLKAAIRYVFYGYADPVIREKNKFPIINLGIMVNHNKDKGPFAAEDCPNNASKVKKANKDAVGCSTGGFILKKATELREIAHFEDIYTKLSTINRYDDPNTFPKITHPYQGVELFFELFRYLTGEAIWNAHVDNQDVSPQVPNGDDFEVDDKPTITTSPSWDADAETNEVYNSPIVGQCSKVYTINFFHGVSLDDVHSNDEINSSAGGFAGILEDNLPWGDAGIPDYTGGQMDDFERILLALNHIDFGDGSYTKIPDYNELADENWEIDVTSFFFKRANNNPQRKVQQFAAAGGGLAYVIGEDPRTLIEDINEVLNNILSTSTTFVSASVPVNVFNRSQFLNNVYLAIFEAEESGNPRWVGNLKRLALNDTVTRIVDKNKKSAFLNNGKLAPGALSYWTDPDGFDIWDYTLDVSIGGNYVSDGQYIDRGGAGQQIPGYLASAGPGESNSSGLRKLYIDDSKGDDLKTKAETQLNATDAFVEAHWGSINKTAWAIGNHDYIDDPDGTNTLDVNTYDDNGDEVPITYAMASAVSKTIALNILKYARGYDVSHDGLSLSGIKRWMLGDPIHSKPVPINYGSLGSYTEANPDIRIVMGSNDGIFRMIENNLVNGNDLGSGKELWGFMPQELLSVQHDLMRNKPTIPPTPLHPYGIDGAPIVYAEDKYREIDGKTVFGSDGTLDSTQCIDSDCDKVYVFFSLRRGGKSLYALDISNPDEPKFMWKINKTSGGDFDELGYTFSNPRVININYADKTDALALVFSAGYDFRKDEKNIIAGGAIDIDGDPIEDGEGRAIYIVDAKTGDLIWKAANGDSDNNTDKVFYHSGLLDSMPSEVTAIDTSGNNSADRMYVGDTGGNIWRIDLYGTNTSKWGMYKFASLGRHTTPNKLNDRRFFHRPDFVKSRDAKGMEFDAVILGSGDRANPKDRFTSVTDIPQNHLYMIKDKNSRSEEFDYRDSNTCNNKDVSNDGRPCMPAPITLSNLFDLTSNCIQDADVLCGNDPLLVTDHALDERYYFTVNGWYIRLVDFSFSGVTESIPNQGEKSLSSPLTLGGTIFYTTYLPDAEFNRNAAISVAQLAVDTANENIADKEEEISTAEILRDTAQEALGADPDNQFLKDTHDAAQSLVDSLNDEKLFLESDLAAANIALTAANDVPESGTPSSCGPSEGSGLAYAVDLHNAGANINLNTTKSTTGNIDPKRTKEDRILQLGSGIPADVVPLGDGKVLLPGGIIVQVPSAGTWRTFWYENLK